MGDDRVPVKTIMVTIGLVVATGIALYVAVKLAHIWALLIVAAFFAVLLTPPVDWVRRHVHVSRGMATAFVLSCDTACDLGSWQRSRRSTSSGASNRPVGAVPPGSICACAMCLSFHSPRQ